LALAEVAAREALHEIPVYRTVAGIDPGATTILRFLPLPGIW